MSNGSHDDAPVPIYHYFWTQQAQDDPADSVVRSPLLRLTRTSHVNQIRLEQVSDARDVLKLRRKLWSTARSDGSRVVDSQSLRSLQRRLVERFLADRNTYFGPSQCAPLDCVSELVDEGRDIFVIVKFMDEAPHIRATFLSLLNQRNIEPGRIVIIAVDNNSTDGSREVVQGLIEESETAVRLIYLNQAMPGAGHAARLGVDRAIATLHAMCQLDEDWQRLQTAVIAVSDGDTVYQPNVMSDSIKILEADPTVDGVMPFLIYKSAAALRLFARYYDYRIDDVRSRAVDCEPVPVPISLSTAEAYEVMPRWQRRLVGEQVELWVADEGLVAVPLKAVDQHGRRFGVIRDAVGHTGFVFEDRSVILTEAPVSGFDAALVFLENGDIGATEKWRWHSLIGLDIFLYWAFAGMGMPEEMVYPDTSDALKMLRAWSFAIGGQHQLADVGLRIATGSDYQSGRVLQAVGCAVRLGPARAFAETEPDRLIKMVRNLANHQSVFYGDTRGAPWTVLLDFIFI